MDWVPFRELLPQWWSSFVRGDPFVQARISPKVCHGPFLQFAHDLHHYSFGPVHCGLGNMQRQVTLTVDPQLLKRANGTLQKLYKTPLWWGRSPRLCKRLRDTLMHSSRETGVFSLLKLLWVRGEGKVFDYQFAEVSEKCYQNEPQKAWIVNGTPDAVERPMDLQIHRHNVVWTIGTLLLNRHTGLFFPPKDLGWRKGSGPSGGAKVHWALENGVGG